MICLDLSGSIWGNCHLNISDAISLEHFIMRGPAKLPGSETSQLISTCIFVWVLWNKSVSIQLSYPSDPGCLPFIKNSLVIRELKSRFLLKNIRPR